MFSLKSTICSNPLLVGAKSKILATVQKHVNISTWNEYKLILTCMESGVDIDTLNTMQQNKRHNLRVII